MGTIIMNDPHHADCSQWCFIHNNFYHRNNKRVVTWNRSNRCHITPARIRMFHKLLTYAEVKAGESEG